MTDTDSRKIIGSRIKQARAAIGLTQKELCEKTGMKLPSLRDYELGNSIPGGDALADLMRADINANWLLTGEGPMLLSDLMERPGSAVRAEIGRLESEMRDEQMLQQLMIQRVSGGAFNVEPAAAHKPAFEFHKSMSGDANNELNEHVLYSCMQACISLHGEEFGKLDPVIQVSYACNLYNLLARMFNSQGGSLNDVLKLEPKGLADQLATFIKLGWAKEFPPQKGAQSLFF